MVSKTKIPSTYPHPTAIKKVRSLLQIPELYIKKTIPDQHWSWTYILRCKISHERWKYMTSSKFRLVPGVKQRCTHCCFWSQSNPSSAADTKWNDVVKYWMQQRRQQRSCCEMHGPAIDNTTWSPRMNQLLLTPDYEQACCLSKIGSANSTIL